MVLSNLISLKNIENENIEKFINPKISNCFGDPYSLLDMQNFVDVLYNNITKNKAKIGVFGDYDADGICSTTILYKYFKMVGVDVDYHIPNRENEGYGPNYDAIKKLIISGCEIIICVDCGTTNFDLFEQLKQEFSQIKFIVIDHHKASLDIPKIDAVVNPNRIDDISNLNNLCAAGVVFYCIVALNSKLNMENFFGDKKTPNMLQFLDLVCVATISDMMILDEINRSFIKVGLGVLGKKHNKGLAHLLGETKNLIGVGDIGFNLGPKINATGRIDDPNIAVKLLISNDNNEIIQISKTVETLNNQRKEIQEKFYNIIVDKVIEHKLYDNNIIYVDDENISPGVIGIVAGKIKDKFNKPTIVATIDHDNNISKGSARSNGDIDIGNLLINAQNIGLLTNAGGHKNAAGMTLNLEKKNEFLNYIYAYDNIVEQNNIEYFDMTINTGYVNIDTINEIEKLGPFGMGNPEPLFHIENVQFNSKKIINNKHIMVSIKNDISGQNIDGMIFNAMENNIGLQIINSDKTDTFNLICLIKTNTYRGYTKPQIIIKDIIL